jgi:hypothetical protein
LFLLSVVVVVVVVGLQPTYPINAEAWVNVFRSNGALRSPTALAEWARRTTTDDDGGGSGGSGGGGRGSGDGGSASCGGEGGGDRQPLYDTTRKNRYTPASYCDGELSFFV